MFSLRLSFTTGGLSATVLESASIQALSASAESSGGVILRLTTEIASTRIAAEKEKPTACSDLIPQPH